jgi:hypothetical protein
MTGPRIVLVCLAALAVVPAADARQGAAQQTPTFRASTDVVTVDVSVRNGSDRVAGLKPSDFVVTDDGVPQRVDEVESSIVPVDITVLAETDDTVADEAEDISKQATRIAEMVRPIDRLRVWNIRSGVNEIVPLGAVGPSPSVPPLPAGGLAAVYDGLAAALMEPVAPDGRHLIIAITNGVDTDSVLSLATVRDIAARSNATLHVSQIDVVEIPPPSSENDPIWLTAYEDSENHAVWRAEPTHKFWLPHYTPPRIPNRFDPLGAIVTGTGGKLHTLGLFVEHNAFDVFENAFKEFQTNYILRYTPQGVARGGWHDLVVKVPAYSGYVLHARRGYNGDEAMPPAVTAPAPAPPSVSPIEAALSGYEHQDYAELITLVTAQTSVGKFVAGLRAAGNVFPTSPRREAVMALEVAQRALTTRTQDAHDQAIGWLADESRLVEPPLGPDAFEHAWRAAAIALLEAQVTPSIARPFVATALERFPDDAAFQLADAIVADQQWPVGTEAVMSASDTARHATDVIARYDAAAAHVEAPLIVAEARLREAWFLHRMSRHAEALAMLDAVRPADADPAIQFLRQLFRGHVLTSIGRATEAVEAFRAASALMPTAVSAQVALMNALLAAGDPDAAVVLAAHVETMAAASADPWHLYWQGDYRRFPDEIVRLREMGK